MLLSGGQPTLLTIADMGGDGFVVYLGDDEWGRAPTLAEAQQIALRLFGA